MSKEKKKTPLFRQGEHVLVEENTKTGYMEVTLGNEEVKFAMNDEAAAELAMTLFILVRKRA